MMTPIDHNSMMVFGKPFITAKEAALRLGYTQDYIGQLVRKGAVNGKLIGRTWYVDLEALQAHKERKVFRSEPKLPDTKYTAESAPLVPKLAKRAEPSQWDVNPGVVKHALVGYAAAVTIIASGIFIAQDFAPALADRSLNALTEAGEKQEELFASAISSATLPYRQVAASGFFQDVYGGFGIVTDFISSKLFTGNVKLADEPKYIELKDLDIVRENLRSEILSAIPAPAPVSIASVPSQPVYIYRSETVDLEKIAETKVIQNVYNHFHHQTDRNVDLIPRAIDTFREDIEESFDTLDLISASSTLTSLFFSTAVGTSATITQATTTSLFSTNASFNTLNLTQLSNGSNILRASRITDTIPTGDFISYWNAAGDTQLFRVDNSGNVYAGGIANSGAITITSATTPQLRVQYDSNNEITTAVSSTGTITTGIIGTTPRAIWMPSANSTSTYQFQNAAGTSALTIDTTNLGITTTNSTSTNATSTNFFATNLSAGNIVTTGTITAGNTINLGSGASAGIVSWGGLSPLIRAAAGGNVNIQSDNNAKNWIFGADGSTTFPSGAVIGVTTVNTSGTITSSAAVGLDLSNAAAVLRLASSNALDIANSRLRVGNGFNGVTLSGKVGVGLVNEADMAGVAAGSLAMEQNSYLYTTRGGSGAKILIGYDTGTSKVLIDNGDVGVLFGAGAEFGGAVTGVTALTTGTIYGGTGATQTLTVRNTSGNANNIGIDIGSVVNSDNGGITFYTAGTSVATERMRIMGTSGNVGIGASVPTYKLDVVSTGANIASFAGSNEANMVTISTTTNNYTKLKVQDIGGRSISIATSNTDLATSEPYISAIANGMGGGVSFSTRTDADSNFMSLLARGDIGFWTNSGSSSLLERMRITSAGNVGIGTTTPNYPLQVRRAGGAGSFGINIDNVVGLGDRVAQYYSIGDTTTVTTGHAFYVRNSTATDNFAMGIDEGGNVGIGSTNPLAKLQVNYSGAESTSVKMVGGGGATNGNLIFGKATDYSDTFPIFAFTTAHVDNARANDFFRIHSGETSSGAYALRVTTGGTIASPTRNSLVVTSNTGNVGIGTTTPISTLDLYEATGPTNIDLWAGNYGANHGRIQLDSAALGLYSGSDTSPELYILHTGNVGIGISTPGDYGLFVNKQQSFFGIGMVIGYGGSDYPSIGYNLNFNGSTNSITGVKYQASDFSSQIRFYSGRVETYTAPSGTTGNAITFTQGPFVAQGGNSWTNGSDMRLKTNVESLSVLDRLEDFRAVSFDWLDPNAEHPHDFGVIAQELYEVFPEAVYVGEGNPNSPLGEGVTPWGVQYDKLSALALQAAKELNDKVEDIEFSLASASTSLTVSSSTENYLVATVLKALDATFENAVLYIKTLIVDKLIAKNGVVIYDRVTGEPVCSVFENGVPKYYPGDCSNLPSAQQGSGGGSGSGPAPQPIDETATSMQSTATSTPDTDSSTPYIEESAPESESAPGPVEERVPVEEATAPESTGAESIEVQ